MGEFKGYRERSRANWGTDDDSITLEQVNTGAFLRIADASEKMASSYDRMREDRDYWQRRATRAEEALATEKRRTAALRGVVKRRRNA